MRLTVADLVAKNACKEGIAAFRSLYGEAIEMEWTLEAQLNLLKTPLHEYLGWVVERQLLPLWSMKSANLQYASLQYASLQYANLQYASLQYASLQYANLQYANLQYANLQYANLQRADLRRANLQRANLRFANLLFANLQYAIIDKINLSLESIKSLGYTLKEYDEYYVCTM